MALKKTGSSQIMATATIETIEEPQDVKKATKKQAKLKFTEKPSK